MVRIDLPTPTIIFTQVLWHVATPRHHPNKILPTLEFRRLMISPTRGSAESSLFDTHTLIMTGNLNFLELARCATLAFVPTPLNASLVLQFYQFSKPYLPPRPRVAHLAWFNVCPPQSLHTSTQDLAGDNTPNGRTRRVTIQILSSTTQFIPHRLGQTNGTR
jgi:hypothetical protein